MMIPKYIKNKITIHNNLLKKAIKLENEIDQWYSKKITHTKYYNDIPDTELCEIKCNEEAMYISMDNINYNIEICQKKAPSNR